MDTYVDLDRIFSRVDKDTDENVDLDSWVGLLGGLHWRDVLGYPRVVLLAEASSGKTREFQGTAQALRERGQAAFFCTVEQLATRELASSLSASDLTAFKAWAAGSAEAWFFLDSVDEARLTAKRFEDALNSLARGLDGLFRRAHVLISCRMSDWRGRADRVAISELLPLPAPTAESEPPSPEEALLAPIMDRGAGGSEDKKEAFEELLVVRLVALTTKQQLQFAAALGVTDARDFVEAINQHGLDAWAERPGDLEYLASYWKAHKQFEALSRMIDHSVSIKLSEVDEYRPDNSVLTDQKARNGAERLAGALSLCKATTFEAPGQEPDATLAAGALSPRDVLPDWLPNERNALLRRGAFAPSTYGRVRFHHRSTQEYLTACWLDRMFDQHPQTVNALLFTERYDVSTVTPSLRPAAAWLSLWRDEIRDEVLRREPIILLQYGDPRSLPPTIRERLLLEVATRQAEGQIADDHVDNRSLWAFATPDIADAVRRAWELNERSDFRLDLLRIIREGRLSACSDLASAILADEGQGEYHRIVAAQGLRACQEWRELEKLKEGLVKEPTRYSPRLLTEFAKVLFPRCLNVDQLMRLIDEGTQPEEYSTEGFNYAIDELWGSCPANDRLAFVEGLVSLGERSPHVGQHEPISQRHARLIEASAGLCADYLERAGEVEPPRAVVRLLLFIQWASRFNSRDDDAKALIRQVNSHAKVQRALFWASAEAERSTDRGIHAVWQLQFLEPIWHLDTAALSWLREDLATKSSIDDRRLALSAILEILRTDGSLDREAESLRTVLDDQALLADLNEYLTPKPREETQRAKEHQRRLNRERAKNADAWKKFRDKLMGDPAILANQQALENRQGWSPELYNLTDWLRRAANCKFEVAPLQWRNLIPVFGQEVADAYVDGMKAQWRVTPPEAPIRKEGGGISTKWATILAFGGVGLEASLSEKWYAALSDDEVKRAAQHACVSERDYPDWMDTLLETDPVVAVPIVESQLRKEWGESDPYPIYVLHRFANTAERPVPDTFKPSLLRVFSEHDPPSLVNLDYGLQMILRAGLSEEDTEKAATLARQRFDRFKLQDTPRATRYLAMLLALDSEEATSTLSAWVDELAAKGQISIAQEIIGALFGNHNPLAPIGTLVATASDLERLIMIAYQAVDPADDRRRQGMHTPDARDDAESGRNTVVKLLADSSGEEAYRAMVTLANHANMAPRRIRFLELARAIAERDAELAPYSVTQVANINSRGTLPVRTDDDLYNLVLEVIDTITWSFDHEDASSRALLESAEDEDAVQEWLAEQFRLRAKDRYHVHRESEVAEGNMPDIVISSTDGLREVAVEAKHGDKKDWTLTTLRHALKEQLVEDYLRPERRRRGVLVITRHHKAAWIDTENNNTRLDFAGLISVLNGLAERIKTNSVGTIRACVRGIDAKARTRRRSGQVS